MRNSVEVEFSSLPPSSEDHSILIELSFDRSLKSKLETVGLAKFWLHISNEHTVLSLRAVNVLLPFTTTYLCDPGFSVMIAIKQNEIKNNLHEFKCPMICDSVADKTTHRQSKFVSNSPISLIG